MLENAWAQRTLLRTRGGTRAGGARSRSTPPDRFDRQREGEAGAGTHPTAGQNGPAPRVDNGLDHRQTEAASARSPAALPVWNISNTRSRSSSGIPAPVSLTVRTTARESRRASTSMRSPTPVNLTESPDRQSRTASSRSASPDHRHPRNVHRPFASPRCCATDARPTDQGVDSKGTLAPVDALAPASSRFVANAVACPVRPGSNGRRPRCSRHRSDSAMSSANPRAMVSRVRIS